MLAQKIVIAQPNLPKTLKKRADFLDVRKGTRLRGPFFVVDIKKRDIAATDQSNAQTSQQPRVGYTVTKRQGNAVERNRMKRRLRALVRDNAALNGNLNPNLFMPHHDYVITAQRDVLTTSFERLTKEFSNRARKAHQKISPSQS